MIQDHEEMIKTLKGEFNEVFELGRELHEGQFRTDGSPYHHHTERVALELHLAGCCNNIIIAGCLHDSIEDTNFTFSDCFVNFGEEVAILVCAVTNVFTKENYPNLNRTQRKAREAARLGTIPLNAKYIKIADMIDNLSDVFDQKPTMAKQYVEEKTQVLAYMLLDDPSIISHTLTKKLIDVMQQKR